MKIFSAFLRRLFDLNGLTCLERDISRRFSKPMFKEYGFRKKLKYLRRNAQYLTLIYYRLANACKVVLLKRWFEAIYEKSSLKTGVEFSTRDLGGGVIMPHWGRIILNAESIGENLYVFHNVTIGNDYTSGKPKIGNNVFIGTNSVILGDIIVGDNVVIGACSFVNTNIPSNSIAVGNPAKVIKSIEDGYISSLLGY